jgi:hypothetical protein
LLWLYFPWFNIYSKDFYPYFLNYVLCHVLGGGEWSSSCPIVSPLVIQWIGGWMGRIMGQDVVEKKETHCPCWELNPGPSVMQPIP